MIVAQLRARCKVGRTKDGLSAPAHRRLAWRDDEGMAAIMPHHHDRQRPRDRVGAQISLQRIDIRHRPPIDADDYVARFQSPVSSRRAALERLDPHS